MIGVAVSLAMILLYGALEAGLNRQAVKRIPLRIQVNGIRGKSTVTRLIYGALRANGVQVMAKTTGTEARVLLPDGSERPVRRWGPPNIRETLWFLREARRQGATAVVVECMAVRPELQWTVEHRMVLSTHGVITNVRHDHLEAMGLSLPEIAASLGNTIPAGGVLITGDAAFEEYFRRRAEALGTTVLLAEVDSAVAHRVAGQPEWIREDEAIALALVRSLGLDETRALEGMRQARPDPGVVATTRVLFGAAQADVVNAMAANDPESFGSLYRDYLATGEPAVIVYNHRRDRPERLKLFLGEIARLSCGQFVITGDPPPWTVTRSFRRRLSWRYVPASLMPGFLENLLGHGASLAAGGGVPTVLTCGNIKGAAWFEGRGVSVPGEAVAPSA